MDDYYDVPKNPVGYGILSLLCGVAGTVIAFTLEDLAIVSVILGAVGLVVGGYGINLSGRMPKNFRAQYMGWAAAGIMTSVIAFMFGFVNVASLYFS
jgi:hypothetical protein